MRPARWCCPLVRLSTASPRACSSWLTSSQGRSSTSSVSTTISSRAGKDGWATEPNRFSELQDSRPKVSLLTLPMPAIRSSRDQSRRATKRELRIPRKRRWPPGVRMLPIRPEAAQRVTVFGSTRKQAGNLSGCQEPVTVLHCDVPFCGTRCCELLSRDPSQMCVHAEASSRLRLAHVSCLADKKVGVVVTRRSLLVAKLGYKGLYKG